MQVQLQQLMPQLQSLSSASQSAATGNSTFMDELRSRMTEAERSDTTAVAPAQVVDEENESGAVQAESETLRTATKKTQKKQDDEKSSPAQSPVHDELATEQAVSIDAYAEIQQLLLGSDSYALSDSDASIADEVESLSEQQYAWLFSTEQLSADDVAVDTADFEALLANAEEYIPGNESESEKLLQAQTLAASDPALFLARAPESAEEPAAADLLSMQMSPADAQAQTKARALEGKKSPFRFEIHDMRSEQSTVNALDASDAYVQRLADRKEFNAAYAEQQQERNQLTMELAANTAAAAAEQNITSSSTQAAGAASSTFQSMLASAVQENAPDFVRAGSIVLRDNNQGAINLILHPESLGNVKIQLSLSDKVISGQITVHSNEAYQAFKEGIDSIKQAFAQSGFDTGSFDLNFAGNNNFAQGESSGQQQDSAYRAKATYGDFITPEQATASAEKSYPRASLYAVDIVA